MFVLSANKTQLTLRRREPVTSGSVNVYQVKFEFSDDWNGLDRTAIFRAGDESRAVKLAGDNETVIPWEVLKQPLQQMYCGVYGTEGGHTVLPTIWACLGTILEGAFLGEDARPPTPELWEQQLAGKGDSLGYTYNGELGLYSGDRLLSSVPIESGGGEGGTADHRRLSHRDAAEQQPITSISGLEKELNRIPVPVEALTNTELEEMLK